MTKLQALENRQKADGTYPTFPAGMERRNLMASGTANDPEDDEEPDGTDEDLASQS